MKKHGEGAGDEQGDIPMGERTIESSHHSIDHVWICGSPMIAKKGAPLTREQHCTLEQIATLHRAVSGRTQKVV